MYDNPQMALALDFLRNTGDNLFLTGKAGTGKTTFLKQLKGFIGKSMVVVAPTGVAALNAGGVTIHSLFQLPMGPIPPGTIGSAKQRFSREKIAILRSVDLLVIDEVSMVRADVMDAVSDTMRRYRNGALPFGGVQLLMIGDVSQLAPVTKSDEVEMLAPYYPKSFYFFDSLALSQTRFRTVELTHIYRQDDKKFIDLLEAVRCNNLTKSVLSELNDRYLPGFEPAAGQNYITLTSHVNKARVINERKMAVLKTPQMVYQGRVVGDFPESMYPNDYDLVLKQGAQVMFLRNDTAVEKLYYNGKLGVVKSLEKESIVVTVQDAAGREVDVQVAMAEWSNIKYSVQNGEITETLLGTFHQYPLKAAWAITIHKSQGLTFDRAVVDAGESFSHGQVYVALSRCRSLEGLVLGSPISPGGVIYDSCVAGFSDYVNSNQPTKEMLLESERRYFDSLMGEMFDFGAMHLALERLDRLAADKLYSAYPLLSDKTIPSVRNEFRSLLLEVGSRTANRVASLRAKCDLHDSASEQLLDLIRRAASYFLEKLGAVLSPMIMQLADLEIDNKDTAKRLGEIMAALNEQLKVKQHILKHSLEATQMTTQLYLRLRSEALLTQAEQHSAKERTSKQDKIESTSDIEQPELFEILRAWRKYTADELGLPLYHIMTQKTLVTMANTMPIEASDMKKIKGIGPKFMERYGAEVAQIIANYRGEQGGEMLNFSQIAADNIAPKVKTIKDKAGKESRVKTDIVTLELFEQGLSVAQIAAERSLTDGTVINHLLKYVTTGRVDIFTLVTPVKVALVKACTLKYDVLPKMSELKSELGEEFSYGDIHAALFYINEVK